MEKERRKVSRHEGRERQERRGWRMRRERDIRVCLEKKKREEGEMEGERGREERWGRRLGEKRCVSS